MKCKCTNVIPEGRLALGYRTCIKCSTTELYSYIPIIGNKTSARATNCITRTICSCT